MATAAKKVYTFEIATNASRGLISICGYVYVDRYPTLGEEEVYLRYQKETTEGTRAAGDLWATVLAEHLNLRRGPENNFEATVEWIKESLTYEELQNSLIHFFPRWFKKIEEE